MANSITRRRRRITVIGAAAAVAALPGMAMSAPSDQSRDGAAPSSNAEPSPSTTAGLADCDVELAVESASDTGSILELTVTAGEDTVQGWWASWLWPDDTEITHVFDVEGLPEQRGPVVEVAAHPHYGYIEPGGSITFAFEVDTPWMQGTPQISSHCSIYNP